MDFLFLLVGVKGFEPSTSNSRSWRANRTVLHPELLANEAAKIHISRDYPKNLGKILVCTKKHLYLHLHSRNARVAELVDAHVSGACVARRAGSTPVPGTQREKSGDFSALFVLNRVRHGGEPGVRTDAAERGQSRLRAMPSREEENERSEVTPVPGTEAKMVGRNSRHFCFEACWHGGDRSRWVRCRWQRLQQRLQRLHDIVNLT